MRFTVRKITEKWLVWDTGARAVAIVDACAGLPRPLVLLGDLNLRAPEPADLSGFEALGEALTHPVDDPVRQIDHVLVDPGAGVRVVPAGPAVAVDTGLSDHRALVVDVRVQPSGGPGGRGGLKGPRRYAG